MDFRASDYGEKVARLLGYRNDGCGLMALAPQGCTSENARADLKRSKARDLFPAARSPEGALSGLYLYFGCLDEAHEIAQNLGTADGSFWHGIMHRQEPDAGNAAYWFRKVGKHEVFPALRDDAHRLRFDTGREWDPFLFIDFCDSARQRPGSDEEGIAMRVQLSEWQLLFDHCAREKQR